MQVNINRQLLGLEDLLSGPVGSPVVLQTRNNQQVPITPIDIGSFYSAQAAAQESTASKNIAVAAANTCTAIYDQFDDRYLGAKATAPLVDNDGNALVYGALYFDTVQNFMKVWSNAGWINAGSSVNGTTERYTYSATAGQTVFVATYEAGYIDVFLNGSKLQNGVDFTALTATNITLTSPASLGDVVDIICYAVFELSTAPTKDVVAYTVSTVADLTSIPSIYTTAIVKDLDRGGTFIWSATGTANGGTVFAGATGFWHRQYSGAVNVKWFGAVGNGITDDAVSVQNAVNYAKASGTIEIQVDNDIYCASDIAGKGSVIFVGDGSITGVYRKSVFKNRNNKTPSFNNVKPEHLKRFLSKDSPIVVVVGDSISSVDGHSLNGKTNSLYAMLRNKFQTTFPDKTITFFNRAISGESYFTACGAPSSFPDWYIDHGAGWPVYVGNVNPDLVIFNFGMNDSDAFQSSTIDLYETYLDNISLFPSGRPDIIHCTNITPALDSSLSDFGTKFGQEGRDFAAGYIRNWCNYKGYGLFDFNRQCSLVKDGLDNCNTALQKVGSLIPTNGAIVATEECIDFKLDMVLSGLAVGASSTVKLGTHEVVDVDARGAWLYIGNNLGNLELNLYHRKTDIYANISPVAFAVPVGSFTLSVEKRGRNLIVSINNVEVASYNKLLTHGKLFLPRAGDATYISGYITSAIFYKGVPKQYFPSLVNNEIFGESTLTIENKIPFGGNGVNHPSGLGTSAIFATTLDMSMNGFERNKNLTVDTINVSTGISTYSGSQSIPSHTPITVKVLDNLAGATYLINVFLPDSPTSTAYSATSIVNVGADTSIISALISTAGISISMSGRSVVITQVSTITVSIKWKILRLF